MPDRDDRLEELRLSAEVMARLAEDQETFNELFKAFRGQDADRFQAVLERLDLLHRCSLVCRYLCSKHVVQVCRTLVGQGGDSGDLDVEEWRQFAEMTGRIGADAKLLRQLVEVVDAEDAAGFKELLARLDAHRFAHQLCHWVSLVRCGWICHILCPPPPLVTQVGLIPAAQILPSGYAGGPSFPPGPTPSATKSPGGVGDHPYGGTTNVKGVFNTTGATAYKVELTPSGGGAPTAISPTIYDFRVNPVWYLPGEPFYVYYYRAPAGEWYAVADMGLLGQDYLTDWDTRGVADGEYDLALTVRTATLAVRVVVDNTSPSGPGAGGRPIMTILQDGRGSWPVARPSSSAVGH